MKKKFYRKLVIGDIHGAYKALVQCLERANYDEDGDTLIILGDVCDGWAHVKECIDLLITLPNVIYIIGNHDQWTLNWMNKGQKENLWLGQGGTATIQSYCGYGECFGDWVDVPEEHKKFLRGAHLYLLDGEKLFLHGGIELGTLVSENKPCDIIWDRELIKRAVQNQRIANKQKLVPKNLTPYQEVFLGHTTTLIYGTTEPIHACEVWDLDTGAGYRGKVTIMDVDTKEYWQSDFVKDLYPNERGRK